MSLLEDIKRHYEDENYPPDASELDYELVGSDWDYTERVSYEIVDDSLRWGNMIQVVYRRGDELVAVRDVEPATEMQNWGDYGEPTIYPVRPVEVTIIKYEEI